MDNGYKKREIKHRYNTRQEVILIDFFKENDDMHFTADEAYICVRDEGISRATVYRRLERLVEDGILIKYSFDGRASACYQYCCDEHKDNSCHFVCTQCKRVEHIDCSFLDQLREHLNCDHNIKIDNARTVFYGVCGGCVCKD